MRAVAPKMIAGPIASGEKVVDLATNPFFQQILKKWPKIIAVEMEGAGVAEAIKELNEHGTARVDYLVIRGISDMPRMEVSGAEGASGQSKERDDWKPYASASAAAFLAGMIREVWPVVPRHTT